MKLSFTQIQHLYIFAKIYQYPLQWTHVINDTARFLIPGSSYCQLSRICQSVVQQAQVNCEFHPVCVFSSSILSHNQTAKCTLSPPAGWSKHGNVSSFNLRYNLGIKLKNWLQLHNSVEVFMHEEMCYNGCRTALTSFTSCRKGFC